MTSSWSAMTCGSTGTKRWFHSSFGSKETMHVRATQPKTPCCWKVLRSTWAPAPPVASEPAIVRATGVEVIPQACHAAADDSVGGDQEPLAGVLDDLAGADLHATA